MVPFLIWGGVALATGAVAYFKGSSDGLETAIKAVPPSLQNAFSLIDFFKLSLYGVLLLFLYRKRKKILKFLR